MPRSLASRVQRTARVTHDHRKHFKNWPNSTAFNALGDNREKVKLHITGRIPTYVAGSLYRTGPGGYKVPRAQPGDGDMTCSHWFDGFTTIHKFDLVRGNTDCSEVWYSSYCQVDELIERARTTGRLEGITFGQKRDPCDTLYQKVKTLFTPVLPESPQSANIGVTIRTVLPTEIKQTKQPHRAHIISVTTDAQHTKQFDADTLEPLGVAQQDRLHPLLTGPISAAHGCHDPESGDVFNYNLAFGPKQTYRIFRASPDTGKVEVLAKVSGRGAYIHSMLLTQNFVILCIWPAFYTGGGASILWHRNILEAIAFDPEAKATWLVVNRRHGRGLVKKFKSPAFFCFHTVNAWEQPSKHGENLVDVVCELVEFNNLDTLHRFYYENLVSDEHNVKDFNEQHRKTSKLGLARYRLPGVPMAKTKLQPAATSATSIAERIMYIAAPAAGDLPRINPNYALKPHRYVWSLLDRGKSSFIDGIGKTDTVDQACIVWETSRHTPSEPIFVPAPDAQNEDQGVILSVVLDGDIGTSYLLCLDASTMQEIGRASVGRAVGMGFHGLHVPS